VKKRKEARQRGRKRGEGRGDGGLRGQGEREIQVSQISSHIQVSFVGLFPHIQVSFVGLTVPRGGERTRRQRDCIYIISVYI